MASPLMMVHGNHETDLIVEKAILAERERCAKIADQKATQLTNGGAINAARSIAAAIRMCK